MPKLSILIPKLSIFIAELLILKFYIKFDKLIIFDISNIIKIIFISNNIFKLFLLLSFKYLLVMIEIKIKVC